MKINNDLSKTRLQEQCDQLGFKINITQLHIDCLTVLADFYYKFSRHPSMRVLIKLLKQDALINNTLELHELFGTGSLLKTMSLLAGLPKPPHCI